MGFIDSIFTFFRFNKKNWKAVVLCLFAATVFWFFNALNKNYAASINFPLVFEYDAEKYIPVNPLPEDVRINVSGLGWDLFRKSVGLKIPALVVPLEKPTAVRKIVGTTLSALFSAQLDGLQINFILTDTLFIVIDHRAKRKVQLQVKNIDRYISKEYGISTDVMITPSAALLEGPRKLLTSLPDTIYLELPAKNIDEDYSEEVEVVLPKNNSIKRNPSSVIVSFKVSKLIEIKEMISFKVINAPTRLKLVQTDKKVNIKYQLPVTMEDKLPAESLLAIVDLKDLPRGSHKLIPRIVGLPKYAHIVKVDTVRVTF